MTSTDISGVMEEHNCDLCKISYVTEKELTDHQWSLMHHIKVEQRKKGSVHKCSLCLTTCPNLIDYGKHLNGDKHKQAIEDSRVHTETHDPQEILSRLQSGDKDEEQIEEPVRSDRETHHRSYSQQSSSRGQFHGNRRPYRRPPATPGQYYDYEGRYNQNSFDNPHWHKGGMRQMYPYQWRQSWEVTSPDPWEHPNHSPEEMEFLDNNRRNSFSEDFGPDRGRYDKFSRSERDHDIDKRRFDSEERKKAVRFEDEVDEAQEYSSKSHSNQESKRRRRNTDVTVLEPPVGNRNTKNSKGRLVESPVCEADSTTDIEITSKTKKDNSKKSDSKKKSATKVKKKKGSKLSPRSDEGESVLERAEKLCKELRDKREKAKKDNQKGKKVEKNQEINQQLAKLSEINKSYVKGVLDDVDESEMPIRSFIAKSVDKTPSSITAETISSSADNRPPINTRSKTKPKMSTKSGVKSTVSTMDSIDTSKPSEQRDVNDIRKEIEADVHRSQTSLKKSLEVSRNEDSIKVSETGELSEENTDSSKIKTVESTSRESLLKMVNSPRSRKERQQLAEVLRTYAKSQNRLSLPRFNLHMSGIYDNLENYGDFRLEELSPDVQLQIAELIEADVKPDLDELEKNLLSEIKAERLDDYLPTSSHEDKSELVNSSPRRIDDTSNHDIQPAITSDYIKKEPEEIITNQKSPQYSQEEREFIEKFCSPGSPVRKSPSKHNRTESQPTKPVAQLAEQRDPPLTTKEEQRKKFSAVGLRSRSNSMSALPSNILGDSHKSEKERNTPDYGSGALELWRKQYSKEMNIRDSLGEHSSRIVQEKSALNEPPKDQQILPTHDYDSLTVQKDLGSSDIKGLPSEAANRNTPGDVTIQSPNNVPSKSLFNNTFDKSNLLHLNSPVGPGQIEKVSQTQSSEKILKAPPVSWFVTQTYPLPHGFSGNVPFTVGPHGNQSLPRGFTGIQSVPLSRDFMENKMYSASPPWNTTVTTWSSLNPPQVMSSSEMSISSGDTRQRSETAESLVQTVYDISIKEEDIRQELQDVDENISRLRKIIEQSTAELEKFREKRASLKKEEEDLRLKRINVLQEAREKQKRPDSRHDSELSDHPTPPGLLDRSTLPTFPGQESVIATGSHTCGTPERTDRLSSNVYPSVSYSGDPYKHRLEALPGQAKFPWYGVSESDRSHVMPPPGHMLYNYSPMSVSVAGSDQEGQSPHTHPRIDSPGSQKESAKTDSPKNIPVHDLLYQGADISFADSIRKKSGIQLPNSLSSDEQIASKKEPVLEPNRLKQNTHSTDVPCSLNNGNRTTSSCNIKDSEGRSMSSEKQLDDIIMVSDDQKQGNDVIIITDSPKRTLPSVPSKQAWLTAEKPHAEFQDSSVTQYPVSTNSNKFNTEEKSHTENISCETNSKSVPIEERDNADAASNLKSYGFITLNNLMTTSQMSPRDSVEQPVKIPKPSTDQENRSDNEKISKHPNDKVNVHYVGSLPHGLDQDEFLKKFRSVRKSDDQMSFLVVDGEQDKDMYDRLQLLFQKPEDENVDKNIQNSSLSEKIRQYTNEKQGEKTLITVSDDDKTVMDTSACMSYNRKKLKTKRERDRASVRKQKEGCILGSSSDYNSPDEDSNYGTKLKSKDPDVEMLADTVIESKTERPSSEISKSQSHGSQIIPQKLLEEVQLETESDDSRVQMKDKYSERFKLKPDFLASLKAAVRSSLSKTDEGVRCHGPEEQVSGLQVVDDEIYVSYIGCTVKKFCLKTGGVIHTFDCTPHQISCLYVLSDSLRLYTGGSSQHLLTFNTMNGQQIRSENLEEKLQCFHHNWGKLFIGTYTGSILVWSTKTDRNIDAYVCSDRPISCISSATEGAQKVILVAAYDSTVFVLSATSGLLIRILEGHTKTVFSLQVDGSVVYSGSGDKTVMEHNLQTGDMTWTYTQATGIITSVCVFEGLLFCSSFDKFIRCYNTEDHKLKCLYYGADRGLVTQMTVIDNKIVTGNRNGIVEVIPIQRDKDSSCQFEGCCHVFGLKSHMLYHVISDHVTPNTKMFRCLWKGCKEWLSTKEGLQEAEKHMKQHIYS